MGFGDWGLGMGDGGLGIGPNPQSPIPNPQSPFYLFFLQKIKNKKIKGNIKYKNIYKIIDNNKILLIIIIIIIPNKLFQIMIII